MLNLSDKELDHFAKEAAQEYDPGDVLGASSWEGLEIRLDRDLGKVHLNPLGHIRRFPFYYAPAMLVLLGVSYYLMRRTMGPPGRVVKAPAAVVQNASSSQSPNYKKTTTLEPLVVHPLTPRAEPGGGSPVGGGKTGAAAGAAGGRADGRVAAAGHGANAGMRALGRNHRGRNGQVNGSDNMLAIAAPAGAGQAAGGSGVDRVANATNGATSGATSGMPGGAAGDPRGNAAARGESGKAPRGELGKVALQGLRPTKKAPYISDSALRAFTLKSAGVQLIRKGGVHINRSLEVGLQAAPDFASVNSLAGDRPGSTIGLTVDYQFANHWYVGSGLLLDRKIFSAYGQDFHAPAGFYAANGMQGDIYLVKGAFEMLEIPLNLRYDFTFTGSTMFFVSGGLSSYLLASQNNNYYYHTIWNPRSSECMPVSSPGKSYLFSALNLQVGVETGLSNSLSLLIAPYMKIPVRGVGIGQMQLSTVGINFALRYAPVISRKRY